MGHSRASRHFAKATIGLKQAEIADRIGCTQGYVSRLLSGKEKPHSRELAVRIGREFGTAADWWDQPEEKPAEGAA